MKYEQNDVNIWREKQTDRRHSVWETQDVVSSKVSCFVQIPDL